jgi:hypothetical protein
MMTRVIVGRIIVKMIGLSLLIRNKGKICSRGKCPISLTKYKREITKSKS